MVRFKLKIIATTALTAAMYPTMIVEYISEKYTSGKNDITKIQIRDRALPTLCGSITILFGKIHEARITKCNNRIAAKMIVDAVKRNTCVLNIANNAINTNATIVYDSLFVILIY